MSHMSCLRKMRRQRGWADGSIFENGKVISKSNKEKSTMLDCRLKMTLSNHCDRLAN